jgi:metallo-beta-lactamase family protein
LLLESTYGNRIHPDADDETLLATIIEETRARGGRVIIPSFAIGRAEELLYWLRRLENAHRIKPIPVYLDSPMAVDALQFYVDHQAELDRDVQSRDGTPSAFSPKRFKAVTSPRESMEIVKSQQPAIVISASGMATGGRVLHHLAACLPDARHTILFVGFQAEGTRGRALVDGARAVKIHGGMVPVAARVQRIDSMSAHADQAEITRWLQTFRTPPQQTYLVHGEPAAQDALKLHLESTLGWKVHIPQHTEKVEVSL